jgi:hypothetical protein
MNRSGKKLALAAIIFVQACIVHADKVVTVSGISSNNLDAYYEGVAKVVEAAAKIKFLSNAKNEGHSDFGMFLALNSLNPIFSIVELQGSDDKLKFYQEGVMQAAQMYDVGGMHSCMPPLSSLSRKDVEKAINVKFEGPFASERLGILIVGAMDAFSEQYPCN